MSTTLSHVIAARKKNRRSLLVLLRRKCTCRRTHVIFSGNVSPAYHQNSNRKWCFELLPVETSVLPFLPPILAIGSKVGSAHSIVEWQRTLTDPSNDNDNDTLRYGLQHSQKPCPTDVSDGVMTPAQKESVELLSSCSADRDAFISV